MVCVAALGFGQLAAADDPSSDPPDARQDSEDGAPSAPDDDKGSAAPEPDVIEPSPDGCPFNNQRLDLIV